MNANPGPSRLSTKFKFLNELDLSQDVVNRLSVYLNSVLKGNSTSILTPIVKDIDPNTILAEWDAFFEANKHRLNDTLIQLEYSNRSKFGPRSIAKPWKDRISDVKSYFNSTKRCRFKSPKFNMRSGNLRPIRISKAVNYLKNSTSAGLPDYVKKGKVKSELVTNFDNLLSRQDPCILFTRTQEGNKTRTVWGFPVADTLNETMFYQPLLEVQKKLFWRAALRGPDDVDKAINKVIYKAFKQDLVLVSADFSMFDASIVKKLINVAFNYIKSLFQTSYHIQLEYIKSRFCNISILTPFGVYNGEHGVPSGSTFTNEVDSLVQYFIAKSSNVVSDEDMQIQGDDGVYAIKESDYNRLKLAFTDAGLIFNESKSYLSKDYVVYLQNLYHKDFANDEGFIGGIYPVYRALNRLCFQERWSNFEEYDLTGIDYYSLRSFSILENCKYHPLFKEFVLFIKSKDKYSLAFSKKGVHKYSELINNGPGTGGVLNHHFGNDIKGIKSFESYKIANSELA